MGCDGQKCWNYESMRPIDLEEAIAAFPVAWLVLSPLEWHGEALSFGCDPIIGQSLCRKAWEKTGGVLFPMLYIGVGTAFKKFEPEKGIVDYYEMEVITGGHHHGSIFAGPLTMELVLRDYLYFMQREKFKLCIIVSGHGSTEHLEVIRKVSETFNASFDKGNGCLKTFLWEGCDMPVPEELQFPGAGVHADFNEASILGGIEPDMVDKSRFALAQNDQKIGLLHKNASKIDFVKGQKILEYDAECLKSKVALILKELGLIVC